MNINPDDPKWTAYVLGELSDSERTAVEKELESSSAAREVVEEIRLTTSLLKEEFAKEAPVALRSDQRRAVTFAAKPSAFTIRRAFAWAALTATVCMIFATITIPSLLRSRQSAGPMPGAYSPYNVPPGAPTPVVQRPMSSQPQRMRAKPSVNAPDVMVLTSEPETMTSSAQVDSSAVKSFAERREAGPGAGGVPADRLDQPKFITEAYDLITDNNFISVTQDTLATFSIDVDTASYANMRRFLTMNQLPPKDAVRIEEMINYFTYDYVPPTGPHPIAAYTEIASAPWKPAHRLVRIGIKGKEVDMSKRPPSNLVFLIDVSGSMESPEKLPLLKSAMKLMIDKLAENDRVAMVVYAGSTGLVLPATAGDKKDVLVRALDNLNAGGSTNGGVGIQLAYQTAISNFIKGGTNRVILATDGDFNVGVTSQGELIRMVEENAKKSGVFLSVLGFGMGNYKDSTLEKLADKGDGNYAYIDSLNEARKVLVEELGGTLMTIAKDVKIQIEFNPAQVNAYRLIGYENRVLRHEDFNNDQKDAGDMGAGHAVTALFEVVPRGVEMSLPAVDQLKYQPQQQAAADRRVQSGELLNLKIRYKEPEGGASKLIEIPVTDRAGGFNSASVDFRFTAAVASFGMILRDSPYKGTSTLDTVSEIGEKARGADKNGYRDEFLRLVRQARALKEK